MENLFSIKNCQALGDYVTAKTPLEEGQLILNEEPLFSFPTESDGTEGWEFACVGCFRTLSSNYMTCDKCLFPICSSSCAEDKFHRELECQVFADNGVLPSVDVYRSLPYARVCLSSNIFPRRHHQFFLLSSELPDSKITSGSQDEVEQAWLFLNVVCGVSVPMSQIMTVMKILTVNAFGIETMDESGNKYRGSAVYSIGCKFTHGCQPSLEWFTVQSLNIKGVVSWNLLYYCKQNIQKGDTLSIAYADTGLRYGTAIRRKLYLKDLAFDCLCSRCVDATEGGTFVSAHKCRTCETGYLLPEDPVATYETVWKCSDCSCVEVVENIFREVATVENDMEVAIQKNTLDSFLEKNSGKILHHNHFLLFKGTYIWLLTIEFKETLLKQSKKSTKLFKKMMRRYSNCIPLVKKFLPTFEIVEFEMNIADAISAFAFNADDCTTLKPLFENPSRKLRFARLYLHHLTRAQFWMNIQPNYLFPEAEKKALNLRCTLWSHRCELYAEELLTYELKVEDTALLKLRSLLIK